MLATGALSASLLTPGVAKAEKSYVNLAKNKHIQQALVKQYKKFKNIKGTKKVNFAKHDPKFIQKTRKIKRKQISASGPTIEGKTRLDKLIDKTRQIEKRTGVKIRPAGVTREFKAGKWGKGRVKISKKGKIRGQYTLGRTTVRGGIKGPKELTHQYKGLKATATKKGLKELSGKYKNFRAYVQPKSKKIGVSFGMRF